MWLRNSCIISSSSFFLQAIVTSSSIDYFAVCSEDEEIILKEGNLDLGREIKDV